MTFKSINYYSISQSFPIYTLISHELLHLYVKNPFKVVDPSNLKES